MPTNFQLILENLPHLLWVTTKLAIATSPLLAIATVFIRYAGEGTTGSRKRGHNDFVIDAGGD